jgi:hypothetical protein
MRGAVKKKLQYSEVQDEFVLSAKQTDVTATFLSANLSSDQYIRQEYSFYSTRSRVSFPGKQTLRKVFHTELMDAYNLSPCGRHGLFYISCLTKIPHFSKVTLPQREEAPVSLPSHTCARPSCWHAS